MMYGQVRQWVTVMGYCNVNIQRKVVFAEVVTPELVRCYVACTSYDREVLGLVDYYIMK